MPEDPTPDLRSGDLSRMNAETFALAVAFGARGPRPDDERTDAERRADADCDLLGVDIAACEGPLFWQLWDDERGEWVTYRE